jgi:Tfp pilus assembly protein PilF
VEAAALQHARGVEAMLRKRFDDARRLLEAAHRSTADPDLLARVESSLAFVALETGDLTAAAELSRRALAREPISPETLGMAHGQHALLLMRRGEVVEALASYDLAIGLLTEPGQLAKALNNRGGVYLQQGRPVQAARDFAAAAREFAVAGSAIEAAMARHNLGYCLLLSGDLVGALASMDEARTELEPLGAMVRATCDQDRAEALLAAGLLDEARAMLRSAARAYGSRRMHQRRGETELILARSLLDDDPPAARAAAHRARRSFDRVGVGAWSARARAIVLAADFEAGRAGPTALAGAAELAETLAVQGLPWRAVDLRLRRAGALVARGSLDEVARELSRLGRLGGAPIRTRLLHRGVRADLAAALGQPGRARQHLRAGLSELHAWQSSFGSLDLQTGVAGHGVRLATRGLALAVDSGRPEVLFEWSERARMLASRVQPVRAPEDDQIVADLAELREMAVEGGRRDPDREAELRQRVRERAWRHRGSGEVADPVTLDALRAALGDCALAAYVVAAERVVALVVTSDAVTWVDLGARHRVDTLLGGLLPDLDMAATDLPGPMAGFVREELAARLAAIADLLVGPVLGAVGDRAVVLTPSGVLAGVPWTLLPGFTGRPLTVAQSATSWLARRTTPRRSVTAGFVAGPRVARAEDEVIAAAKEWPRARVLAGQAATAAGVSELAASVDVLHVAAHGRHSSQNAMFSGLQLADGPWFGYDIDRLRRVPEVVLLSACEVGRSTVRWGDELIGMTTAWLHAGARCVVASPAAVNDRAAYDVLVAVHEQLARGAEPADALAAAVPAVSADTAPVPLVCFG